MKNGIKAGLVALGLMAGASLQAQEGLYVGLDFSQLDYKATGISNAEPSAVAVNVGNRMNENFAVEGRIGLGLSSDRARVRNVPVNVDLDRYIGLYGKGILPLNGNLELYGLLGYTSAKVSVSGAQFGRSGTDDGLSYGLGGQVRLNPSTSLSLEWTKLLDGSSYELEALTVGVKFHF